MALYLAVAVIAAVNVALASQLSLRPEQKAPNIEGRPIFCMIVLFSTAIISGISLILLSINIDLFFTMSVGTLALSSIVISIYHVSKFFDFELPKCMRKTRLSALSLILSSLTFILAVARPDVSMWLTIPNYCSILTYHSLVDTQNMPFRLGRTSIDRAFILCLLWTASSITACVYKSRNMWYAIAFGVVSGLEAITLASTGVGSWMRRRRPRMNLAEA